MSQISRIHSTSKKTENAALFLRLGLPSTLIRHENGALFLRLGLRSALIRHENGAFSKALFIPGKFEIFRLDKEHFETKFFDDVTIITCFFPDGVFLKYKSKWPVIASYVS